MSKREALRQPIGEEPQRVVDLSTSEINLLRRALRIYAKAYQEMMQKTKVQWEKEENARYIEAADALSEKLLKRSRLITKGESDVRN